VIIAPVQMIVWPLAYLAAWPLDVIAATAALLAVWGVITGGLLANALQDQYPSSARVFIDMAEEEHEHRRRLTETYVQKFGDHIPLIRRSDVTGRAVRAFWR